MGLRQPTRRNRHQPTQVLYSEVRYLWLTSGTRREDQELDKESGKSEEGGEQSLPTASLVLPSPSLSFFSTNCGASLAPSLTNYLRIERNLFPIPRYAESIKTILSVRIPEILAASAATPYTGEWVKIRMAFVMFNRYTNSPTENKGFAGLDDLSYSNHEFTMAPSL